RAVLPAVTRTEIFARLEACVLRARQLPQERAPHQPDAASSIEHATHGQPYVGGVGRNEPGTRAHLLPRGHGGTRIEIETLVVLAIEAHGRNEGSRARGFGYTSRR